MTASFLCPSPINTDRDEGIQRFALSPCTLSFTIFRRTCLVVVKKPLHQSNFFIHLLHLLGNLAKAMDDVFILTFGFVRCTRLYSSSPLREKAHDNLYRSSRVRLRPDLSQAPFLALDLILATLVIGITAI